MAIQQIAGGMTSAQVTDIINNNFNELSTATLGDYAVVEQMIATGAITTSKIAAGAITKSMVGLDRASNITITYGTEVPQQAASEGDIYIQY